MSSSAVPPSIFDKYPASAIITNADFVPRLLDLIYKSNARTDSYTIIVVGEVDHQIMPGVASNLRILPFDDVERGGYRMDRVVMPIPCTFPGGPSSERLLTIHMF